MSPRSHGLRAGQRLHTAAEFARARASRTRYADAFFTLQCSGNDRGGARLGMAVAMRVAGSAVRRNRLRRVIRESFRMHRPGLPAVDILVTARTAAGSASNATLFASLAQHWRNVGAGA